MNNITAKMTNEKLHKVLSEYVSKQIIAKTEELSAAEWVKVMNCYGRHESVDACAEKLQMDPSEVKRIYYQFTMYAVNYALDHVNSSDGH